MFVCVQLVFLIHHQTTGDSYIVSGGKKVKTVWLLFKFELFFLHGFFLFLLCTKLFPHARTHTHTLSLSLSPSLSPLCLLLPFFRSVQLELSLIL